MFSSALEVRPVREDAQERHARPLERHEILLNLCVKILKTAEQTVIADYFVICHGSSSTHIKALVDEVDKALSEAGEPPIRREGLRSDIWVLMDFGSVIVHVFTDEARKFYNLERLWSDSEEVALSSLPSPQ